ncbi:uncharacterized protein LOC111128723 isoform X2 [Crassostrea virginica]
MDCSLLQSPPSLRRVIVPMPSSFTEVQISYPQLEQEPQCESNDVSETVQGLPHKGEIMSKPENDQNILSSQKQDSIYTTSCADTASKSSLDLEGALVDRAIESVMTLPQEVQEAVTLQRLQNSEITRCEQYLNSMLEQEKIAAHDYDLLSQELSSINRKIFFTKESLSLKQQNCLKLSKDIEELIKEVAKQNQQIENTERDLNTELKKMESYKGKVEGHIQRVADCDGSSDLQKELIETRARIEGLQQTLHRAPEEAACKDSFNDFKERFEGQMSEVQKLISGEERYIADKHSLISLEKKQQESINKSLLVLEKRNAAQLLRMKKQIKETQLRNRAWNSQIQQLKQNIAMLNDKIQTAEQ